MKHIYILQGKKYISSKRASEISEYSSDYIGQLCREGKLVCQRMGHTWFVTEDSLRAHMTNIWNEDVLNNRSGIMRKRSIKDQRETVSEIVNADTSKRLSSKHAALFSGYSSDYIGQLCRSKKIDGVLVGKTWFVTETSLKDHMNRISSEENARAREVLVKRRIDDEKKFLERRNASAATLAAKTVASAKFRFTDSTRVQRSRKSGAIFTFIKRGAVLLTLSIGILYLASNIIVQQTTFKNSSSTIEQPMVAGVYEVAQWIGNLFGNAFHALASLFSKKPELAVNTNSVVNEGASTSGIAVAPLTGDAEKDADTKAAIQGSFSDEVKVSPDNTGNAGVISPVFKTARSKDFMYVMVPINKTSQSPP